MRQFVSEEIKQFDKICFVCDKFGAVSGIMDMYCVIVSFLMYSVLNAGKRTLGLSTRNQRTLADSRRSKAIDLSRISDVMLSTPELIQKYGYPCEEHTVKTEDGYLLTHFRIPCGRENNCSSKRAPVILQHGILSASDLWLLMGPQKSLGFILADAGYDVWLTNIRGNRHGRRHIHIPISSPKFWDFSWNEMGYYDMPATIDYILNLTGQEKTFYVGHSMGTTILFVMCSTKPEYNNKLRLGIALAPAVFFAKLKPPLFQRIVSKGDQIAKILKTAGVNEVFPYNKGVSYNLARLCHEKAPTHEFCVQCFNIMYGEHSKQLNRTLLPVIVSHLLAGTSTNSLFHYAQIINSGKFQKFNYGPDINMQRYKQVSPPEYDLSNVTCPISLHYGLGDLVVNAKGVKQLAENLPHTIALTRASPPAFNHIDFVAANDAKGLLYDNVMNIMSTY